MRRFQPKRQAQQSEPYEKQQPELPSMQVFKSFKTFPRMYDYFIWSAEVMQLRGDLTVGLLSRAFPPSSSISEICTIGDNFFLRRLVHIH